MSSKIVVEASEQNWMSKIVFTRGGHQNSS